MAGNFQTVKNKTSSEKFSLIRLEPARRVSDDLTLVSGTLYEITFPQPFYNTSLRQRNIPFVVSKVKVDGVEYTRVTTTPSSSEFSYSESTRKLQIDLGAALTTQEVIVFHYLFFSEDRNRESPEDPTVSTDTIRQWLARISQEPTFKENQRDITAGTFSFGLSNFVLNNEDKFFQQYIGNEDSFGNKEMKLWVALDSTSNVEFIFSGKIKEVIISDKVSITLFDGYSPLGDTFYSNDTLLKSTFSDVNVGNTNPIQLNLPIRKLFAEVSYYEVIGEGVGTDLFRVSSNRLLEGVNIDYIRDGGTIDNRRWGTVLKVGDLGDQNDTVSATDHTDPDFSLLTHGSSKKYRIGDTLEIDSTKRVRVLAVLSGSDQIKTTKDATIAATNAIFRPGVSVVIFRQGTTDHYLLYGRDYTLNTVSTANDMIEIQLKDNFEAGIGASTLNPDADRIFFRAWADTGSSFKHGTVLKEILEDAGISTNATSFTQANTDLDVDTNFYVPFVNNEEFPTYQSVVQAILRSTFGTLSFNSSGEMVYKVFQTLTGTTAINDRLILKNSINIRVDYNEVFDSIFPTNDHDILEIGFVNDLNESTKARFLHEVKKRKTYNHVLAVSTRSSTILDVISERFALYTLKTKTHNIDSNIGDEFTIERDGLLGTQSSVKTTIVGLAKKSKETIVNLIDLFGI